MRIGLVLALLAGGSAPVLAAEPSPPPPAAATGCDAAGTSGTLRRVTPDGDLVLDGGEILVLADLRRPAGREGAERSAQARADAVLASFAGSTVTVTRLAGADRWGRVPARVSVGASGAVASRIDLAELLVGEGLARVDPGERDGLCRPDLRDLEAAARRGRSGLWADGAEPVGAGDADRLRKLAGRFVVIEGRLVGVGERPARTYLNFGRDYARDFAVVVPRRLWASLKRTGLSAETLRGRTVRVRGTVELWRSPILELGSADALELLPSERAGRR